MEKTSIIILTFNQLDYTKQCIESIRTYTEEGSYEIIIVDNHSTDGTVNWLIEQQNLKVIYNDDNQGFPKGCNQGIEIATGDNILLLNNDVIVTKNWLDNLLTALYSEENIGAVGPITNSAAYYTAIQTTYKTVDEMHQHAKMNNISDPAKWEERLKLIGFCMLIKKKAVQVIGLLDEQFTPGNFEDDDFSVRLRNNGYKLLLCHDTFIHHFGSVSWKEDIHGYSTLLSGNEQKFKDKWGTNLLSYQIHRDIISEIISNTKHEPTQPINILHIGCQSGGTLLQIKHTYKNAKLYGVESNIFSVKEANVFASIELEYNPKNYLLSFFDAIIITDPLLNLDKEILGHLSQQLKPEGLLFIKVPNLSYIGLVAQILSGNNPFSNNNEKYYGLSEIKALLSKLNLKYEIESHKNALQTNVQEVINGFQHIFGENIANNLGTSHFLIKCKLLDSKILSTIRDITDEVNNNNVEELNQKSINDVMETVLFLEKPIKILQKIAITNFSQGHHEVVLPYLHKAYELDQNNADTIYNIAFVLKAYGDFELAHQYLDSIEEKDEEVQNLQQELKQELDRKNNELVFLLRRFEFDIDIEKTKKEFIAKYNEAVIKEEMVLEKIQDSIIDKIKVLQAIAICCFEHNVYDSVLPFLNAAYEMDQQNYDTLYNLAYVLICFGERESAKNYLNKIKEKDDRVVELIHLAEGVASYE